LRINHLAVCPFSFARPKENGRKEKGAEIETHESIAIAPAVNFGCRDGHNEMPKFKPFD
jgi:hypothetical protein